MQIVRIIAGYQQRSRRSEWIRRCARMLILVSYVLVATGVPVPVPNTAPVAGQRFPCMNGRCGCRTADQCWRSCCCLSMAERLAWAKEHGVEPPDFVKTEATQVVAAKSSGTCGGCVAQKQAKVAVGRSCCQVKPAEVATIPQNQTVDASEDASKTRSLVLIDAFKCRGIGLDWLGAFAAVVLEPQGWNQEEFVFAWLGPIHAVFGCTESWAPTTPPPEFLSRLS